MVRTFLKVYGAWILFFVSGRANKRHYHEQQLHDGWIVSATRTPTSSAPSKDYLFLLGSLAGLSFPVVYVGVIECAPASFPPASSSLTHTRRMDGFCNQNADQLGSLAGLSFPVVYVGAIECASASPYTYSSSTHRFPDERTLTYQGYASFSDICGALVGFGSGFGIGFTLLLTRSSPSHPPLQNVPLPRVH
jgi:hypothetical protein